MQIRLQRRGSERTGCRTAGRVGRITPTTPLPRHSCRRSGRSGVGSWLNRDPIGELGGINLYHFVYNSPVSFGDRFGLWPDLGRNIQECFQNCKKCYSNPAQFVPALRSTVGGHALGLGGTIASGGLLFVGGPVSIVAGIGVVGFAWFEGHEIHRTFEESDRIKRESRNNYAKCVRRCLVHYGETSDNLEAAYDVFVIAR